MLVALKAKELTMFKRNIKTYGDIMFAPIEKWYDIYSLNILTIFKD